MSAEEFYKVTRRSQFNTMFKENRSIKQFDFYDMVDFAEAYHKKKMEEIVDESLKILSEK